MLYSIIGILVIILDQLVKYFVDQNINWTKPVIELIPNVLSLVRVQNDGAAFSFLSGGSARIWFIALTAIFAILVVIALATNFVSGRFGRWCLVFITAGGLSNMIDRIRFGFVIDMFRIDMFDFAVFNVADIFITVFCIAFILYILFGGEKEKEETDEFDEDEDEDEEDLPPRRVRKTRKAQADRYEDEPEEIKPRRTRRRAAEEEDEYEEAPVRTRTRKEPVTATRRNPDTAAYGQNGSARRENPASERRRPEAANEARSVKRAAAPQPRTMAATEPNDDRIFEEMFGGNQPAEKPVQPQRPVAPQTRQSAARSTRTEDPFADWEKANARASAASRAAYNRAADTVNRVKAAAAEPEDAFSEFLSSSAPAKTERKPEKTAPAPRVKTTAPASKADDEFDLDSILDEFK